MLDNYTTQDIAGALRGIAGFSLLLFLPGYVAAWALDLLRFRGRSLPARTAWAITLSFALAPILLSLASHVARSSLLAAALWSVAAVWLVIAVAERRRPRVEFDRYLYVVLAFLFLGALLVVVELVDLQLGSKLYLSVTVVDQAYRVGFTNSLALSAVPPINPFYHPGHAEPLRYYYFWYALCAMCMKLVHITARQALIASSVWAGWGLTALLALLVRHFLGVQEKVHRRTLAAVLLLCVTGADLLPVLFSTFVQHRFMGEIEWWSTDQITSWMDCILWVPNHTAALISCMTGFLLLWCTRQNLSTQQRTAAVCLAGVAAASSFGLSIYVAAGFAMLMLAWMLRLLLWERETALAARTALAAGLAIVLLTPYLHELIQAQSGTQAGTRTGPAHLLSFGVREFILPPFFFQSPHFAALRTAHPLLFLQAVRLLLLVPGYAIELGFYGVVLVVFFKRRRMLDPARRTALFFCVSGLVMVSFIRSGVIENNDFGYRAAMLPCLFLLLLGSDLLLEMRASSKAAPRKPARGGLTVALSRRLLLLGVAGTAYQAFELRLFLPLLSAAHQPAVAGLPEAAYAARKAYGKLSSLWEASLHGPIQNGLVQDGPIQDGLVQANTTGDNIYLHLINMLYSDRATIVDAAADCGAVFGGDPAPCSRIEQQIQTLFSTPGQTSTKALETCGAWGAHYLAAYREDPAWSDPRGWVWTLPLVATDIEPGAQTSSLYRVLDCSGVR